MATAYGAFEEQNTRSMETELFPARRLANVEELPLLRTEETLSGRWNSAFLRRPAAVLLCVVAIVGVFFHSQEAGILPLQSQDAGISGGKELDVMQANLGSEDHTLTIEVVNEYGAANLTKYPFLAEGFGINVEPHKQTKLRVGDPKAWATYHWAQGSSVKDSLELSAVSPTVVKHSDKDAIMITLTATGVYSLTLTERIQGSSSRELTINMYCKYVRRELRTLSDSDLKNFLDAAETVWKISTREGRIVQQLGPKYRDINSLAIIHNDLAGNAICDHLHGTNGYAFVTGHVALNNMLEQSLQAVNPAVSLPYWEYVQDADTCRVGDSECFWEIWDSEVFTESFFGSKGENGEIADGRWANTHVPVLNRQFFEDSMIEGHYREHSYAGCFGQSSDSNENSGCDPDYINNFLQISAESGTSRRNNISAINFTKWADKHVENAFGLLRSPWNLNADRHLSRFSNMCGIKNDKQWPTCDSIIVQQATYDTFADWVLQMQFSPHGSVHTFIGGASGECNHREDLKSMLSYPTFHRLLDKSADIVKDMYWELFIKMPSRDECEGQEQSECGSSCPDLDQLNSTTVSNEDFAELASFQYMLQYFSEDMRKELHQLEPSDKFLLMTHMCSDKVLLGDMLTSNSPLDVTFFHVHAEVERIFQRKSLSGTFTDTTWPGCGKSTCPGWCPGYKLKWFDYVFDSVHPTNAIAGEDEVEEQYKYSRDIRNDELLSHLMPHTEHYARMMPYLYDEFEWRGCSIPKKYKSYVDLSLMNASQWIKPEELEWLQMLAR